MTTRLAKATAHFLPFNRGSHPGAVECGAGNPPNPPSCRTGYLWEEVLARDSLLDILGHFMFVERKDEKVDDGAAGTRRVVSETLVFPRYHQLDAVRKLVAAARGDGVGRNYLTTSGVAPSCPSPACGGGAGGGPVARRVRASMRRLTISAFGDTQS